MTTGTEARAAPARATPRTLESRFFLGIALLAMVIAVTGFSTTFFMPVFEGRFAASPVFHLHGALFFGWLAFLLSQINLVRTRSTALHRRMGWAGAALASGMVVSGIAVGLLAARRDFAAGMGAIAYGQFLTVLIEMLVFGSLVAAAVVFRRRPDVHKRLLLLATISILGAAWVRFRHLFPGIEHPFGVFSIVAASLIVVAAVVDRLIHGRIHPVYWRVGAAVMLVHAAELAMAETAGFQAMAGVVASMIERG